MVAAGARMVLVPPERLAGWLDRFAAGHGEVQVTAAADLVAARAADGSVALCEVPFPPLRLDLSDPWQNLVEHALVDRRIGLLLIRRGGYAAGIVEAGKLTASKVGTRYVQGRTAAGGQSQQRFARRRDNQAAALVGSAVDVAARVLVPEARTLTALVTGGDRPLIVSALSDSRLAVLAALPRGPWLTVGDPRLKVLQEAGQSARGVRITVADG
ncbi:MAG: hypothetical protein M3446_06890 [Actinomycetota bacterium]|nr:hypothetical protein [Geodermatophilaceae bacterium]MDQ3505409.1 hypothetical protein [Actinomycetota bacterium]